MSVVIRAGMLIKPKSIMLPYGLGGDYIVQYNNYKYHVFTNTGSNTFTIVNGNLTVDYLVVGGGGSGGAGAGNYNAAGGGGGGAVITGSLELPQGINSIFVGAGGDASSGSSSLIGELVIAGGGAKGGNIGAIGGSADSILNVNASGGGGGGGTTNYITKDGGSGHGIGNAGGSGQQAENANYRYGGGGGGFSTAGAPGTKSTNSGGNGGDGILLAGIGWGEIDYEQLLCPIGFGAGGGGGTQGVAFGTSGDGGYAGATMIGGKGGVGRSTIVLPTDGVENSGAGGGGIGRYNAAVTAGKGGSGIVIIRYPI